MTVITSCPVCDSQAFQPFQQCEDFTVSHETFKLIVCEGCSFLITSPRPDETNLPKYYQSINYISHSKDSSTIFDKLYRLIRDFAIDWKINLIRKYHPHHISILDLGAGTGSFLKQCHKKGWTITGVEPSQQARSIANEELSNSVKKDLNETTGQFQVITLWHVLEHIPNLDEILSQLKSKLTTDGTMFIAVPNHKSADAHHYRNYWAGYDVPRHLWHFNQSVIKKLIGKYGFKLVETVPMKLDAYYVSMLSETYIANRRNLFTFVKGLISGFNSNLRARKNSEYSSLIYIIKRHA
jgi:SAM-dependent methyltransferase